MSMYITIKGMMEPTEEFQKKYRAYMALVDAGIEVPDELYDYFDNEIPDSNGMELGISNMIETEYTGDGTTYYVDLKRLDPKITKIKVEWS